MLYWIERKIWQVRNLIKWFPIIWNQFDFDKYYAIEVFIFQLKKIATFLESDKAYSMSAKSDASSLRKLISLLEQVDDEKFSCEYQDKFESLYGKIENTFIDYEPDKNLKKLIHKYPKVEGKTQEELEVIYFNMFKDSQEKQNKAHNLVWKLVANHINRFWD